MQFDKPFRHHSLPHSTAHLTYPPVAHETMGIDLNAAGEATHGLLMVVVESMEPPAGEPSAAFLPAGTGDALGQCKLVLTQINTSIVTDTRWWFD